MYGIVVADRWGMVLRSRRVGCRPWGPRRELLAAAQRARRRVIRRVRYDRFDFDTRAAIPSATPPPGVVIRPATGEDLPGMPFPAYMRPMFANLANRPSGPAGIREGHRGWVAVADGEVVACVWATSGPLTLKTWIRVVPGPGVVRVRRPHPVAVEGQPGPRVRAAGGDPPRGGGGRNRRLTSHIDAGNRFNRVVHRIGGVRGERTTTVLLLSRWSIRLNRAPAAPAPVTTTA